jgi:hypothetical protein
MRPSPTSHVRPRRRELADAALADAVDAAAAPVGRIPAASTATGR